MKKNDMYSKNIKHIENWSPKNSLIERVAISLAQKCFVYSIRMKLYKISGIKFGKNVRVGNAVVFAINPNNVTLNDNVEINYGVYFHAREKIIIGKNCAIAPFVKFITSSNPNTEYNKLMEYYKPLKKSIIVEDNVWIGAGAIILPGIYIGEMSVIAAGAVVTEDVLPYTIVGGVPAKILKRFE